MDKDNATNISKENIQQEPTGVQDAPQESATPQEFAAPQELSKQKLSEQKLPEQKPTKENTEHGNGKAVASLVLGIISIVFWFFGATAVASVITGVVGILLASRAPKEGLYGGIRVAGFICSLIGLILGAIVFVACISCVCVIF